MAASTPRRRTGCSVSSQVRAGSRRASRMFTEPFVARYSGRARPAWRMNHTGVRSGRSPRQAARNGDSGAHMAAPRYCRRRRSPQTAGRARAGRARSGGAALGPRPRSPRCAAYACGVFGPVTAVSGRRVPCLHWRAPTAEDDPSAAGRKGGPRPRWPSTRSSRPSRPTSIMRTPGWPPRGRPPARCSRTPTPRRARARRSRSPSATSSSAPASPASSSSTSATSPSSSAASTPTATDEVAGATRSTSVAWPCRDDDQEPLVVDWRAPVAEPFYRATGRHPMGLRRRRHFLTQGRRLTDLEDELFGGEGPDAGLGVGGSTVLLKALERSRTGRMRDIVATVQREQDEIIRAPLARGPRGAGRAGHRQDRRGAAPGRLPALHAPLPARAPGRARRRPQPAVPALHRARAAEPGRVRRRAVHHRRPGARRRCARRRRPPCRPGSRATCAWPRCWPRRWPTGSGRCRATSPSATAPTACASPWAPATTSSHQAKRRSTSHNARRKLVELLVARKLAEQLDAAKERARQRRPPRPAPTSTTTTTTTRPRRARPRRSRRARLCRAAAAPARRSPRPSTACGPSSPPRTCSATSSAPGPLIELAADAVARRPTSAPPAPPSACRRRGPVDRRRPRPPRRGPRPARAVPRKIRAHGGQPDARRACARSATSWSTRPRTSRPMQLRMLGPPLAVRVDDDRRRHRPGHGPVRPERAGPTSWPTCRPAAASHEVELSVNYRTPAEIMELAGRVLAGGRALAQGARVGAGRRRRPASRRRPAEPDARPADGREVARGPPPSTRRRGAPWPCGHAALDGPGGRGCARPSPASPTPWPARSDLDQHGHRPPRRGREGPGVRQRGRRGARPHGPGGAHKACAASSWRSPGPPAGCRSSTPSRCRPLLPPSPESGSGPRSRPGWRPTGSPRRRLRARPSAGPRSTSP